MTNEQIQALRFVASAVIDAVKVTGDRGAPGGVIYAALMASGCTFQQFSGIMGLLVRSGKLRQDGDLYFVTEG